MPVASTVEVSATLNVYVQNLYSMRDSIVVVNGSVRGFHDLTHPIGTSAPVEVQKTEIPTLGMLSVTNDETYLAIGETDTIEFQVLAGEVGFTATLEICELWIKILLCCLYNPPPPPPQFSISI